MSPISLACRICVVRSVRVVEYLAAITSTCYMRRGGTWLLFWLQQWNSRAKQQVTVESVVVIVVVVPYKTSSVMIQAGSCRFVTAETWVQSQICPSGICFAHRGTVRGSPASAYVFPVSIILPLLLVVRLSDAVQWQQLSASLNSKLREHEVAYFYHTSQMAAIFPATGVL